MNDLRIWNRAVGLMLLSGLLGCTAMSPKVRFGEADMTVPDSWSATKAGRAGVDLDWVGDFRDERLREVVNEALANNRDLKAAGERLEQARQQAKMAGADGKPTADLGFGGTRQKQNFIGFPIGGAGDEGGGAASGAPASSLFNQFNSSLNVSWEVDIWGRIRAGQAATIAEAEATSADVRAARASLAAEAARTWFGVAEAAQQVALAEEAERVFQQTADAVRERFEIGQEDGSASQLRLAETDVATAKAARLERKQTVESEMRRLEVLMGRYPAGKLVTAAKLPSVPGRPPAGLPSDLLQRRPDILAAERRFAAAGKRVSEAKRALYPRLSLSGSTGYASGELGDVLNSDFGVWNLAGNAVQPILTGGRLLGEAKVRYSREREALAELQQTVLDAFGEVETALTLERLLAERERALQEAVDLADAADAAAREEFIGGVGDLLTVLTAQNRRLQLRSQALTLKRLRLDNRINLYLALGGDFQVHAP